MSNGIDLEKVIVWANSETNVDYPGSTLEDTGYVGEEQPFNEHHNWIWNVRDKKLNRLTDRANRTHVASPGLSIEDSCSGLVSLTDDDWIHPYSSQNTFFIGANPVIYMCRGWNYVRKQQVIYAVLLYDSTKIIEIRNADDFTIETEDHLITLDNPGSEVIESICCDGPYIYILVNQGGAGKVYKFSTNPWSSTKVASQGTAIIIDTQGKGENKIIVADSTQIAFIGKGEDTASNKVINIMSKALSLISSGSGNAPSSSTDFPGTGLCSDGFTLFFTTSSTGSGNTMLCAANIANPAVATGLGGAFTAKVIGDDTKKAGDTIYDGRHVSVLRDDGYIGSLNKDVDRWKMLDFLFENAKSPDEPFPKMIFDGFTAWAIMQHNGDDDSNNAFIAPFRPQEICLDHPTTRTIQKKQFLSSYTSPTPFMGLTRLEYADGCLWYTPDAGDDPLLYRLPNILNRR